MNLCNTMREVFGDKEKGVEKESKIATSFMDAPCIFLFLRYPGHLQFERKIWSKQKILTIKIQNGWYYAFNVVFLFPRRCGGARSLHIITEHISYTLLPLFLKTRINSLFSGRQRFNVVSEELASRHMRATVGILEDQKQPRLLDPG